MNRRDALKLLGLLATHPCLADDAPRKRQPLGLVIHSYWIRRERPLEPEFGSVAQPLDFLKAAARIGARGIQTKVSGLDKSSLASFREAVENHEMYVEGTISLPRDEADVSRFEADVISSKDAGATILRTVCMNGRRYEIFKHLEEFQKFADDAWQALKLAEPVAARHKVQLAVENHKDWRTGEMLAWLKRLSSEFVGVCLDTGNSIALLEEPHAVVEALAPWTLTTHFKDMAVAESPDGFLLSEVPLGAGFLNLPRLTTILRKARPGIRLNLEMITRDPLHVPCLKPAYWETLQSVSGREAALALGRIRNLRSTHPLPTIKNFSQTDQLQTEADNIAQCLKYAADHLPVA